MLVLISALYRLVALLATGVFDFFSLLFFISSSLAVFLQLFKALLLNQAAALLLAFQAQKFLNLFGVNRTIFKVLTFSPTNALLLHFVFLNRVVMNALIVDKELVAAFFLDFFSLLKRAHLLLELR